MDIVTYALLNGKIKNYDSNVDEWLEENVDPDTGYVLDRSLQMENAAAPADMVGDINDEVGDLKNTLNHKADVIYDTASGDIASFPDGADGLPVKDLTVGIEPVQDLHGYDNPWPAGGGKNLFQTTATTTTMSGVTFTVHNDGHISCSGTANAAISGFVFGEVTLPAGTYKANGFSLGSKNADRLIFHNVTASAGVAVVYSNNDVEFTLAEESVIRVYPIILNGTNTGSFVYYPMIRLASVSDATFAPYSNICPISGWTGCNVTRTGKNLFDKMAYTKQGWFLWTPNPFRKLPVGQAISFSINKIDSESHGFSTTTNAAIGGPPIGTFAGYGFGNEVFTVTTTVTQSIKDAPYFQLNGNWNGLTADMVDNAHFQIEINASPTAYEPYSGTTIPISWQSSAGTVYAASLDALAGSLKVRPYYASYNGETLVGPWISSMDVYTPGGTPTTGAQVVDFGGLETSYSLDAIALNTFLGQNNILADCGPVSVEYQADTKLYIQKIDAPTDDDMIADAQIASGKYFIVNNNLYLSTAAILAGDPIKPGTNCTLTNLAAALNAINS
ncbi:MAG: hypothetical protein IIY21_19225 [Clostridiales bacterium]|nr:hypothetical protein [Clostridiales bacterium]MBQ1572576.1 hypothetical protein [Clostridiales bacterium]